jgi:hypothetical protein
MESLIEGRKNRKRKEEDISERKVPDFYLYLNTLSELYESKTTATARV